MRLAIAQKDEQDQTTFMDLIDGNSELLNKPLLLLCRPSSSATWPRE